MGNDRDDEDTFRNRTGYEGRESRAIEIHEPCNDVRCERPECVHERGATSDGVPLPGVTCKTCDGWPWDAKSSTWCPTCDGKRRRPCALCKGLSSAAKAQQPCTRCGGSDFEIVKACKCGAMYTDSPSGEHNEACTRGRFQRRIEETRAKHGEKVPPPSDTIVDDHGARMKVASAGLTLALARCVSVLVETAMHLEGIDVVDVKAQGPDHPAWRRVKVAHEIEASRFAVVIDGKQATPWHGFLIGVNDETGQIEGVFVPMGDDNTSDTEPPPNMGEELVRGIEEGLRGTTSPTRETVGTCARCGEAIRWHPGDEDGPAEWMHVQRPPLATFHAAEPAPEA